MGKHPWSGDAQFEDDTIQSVEAYETGGWSITKASGWSFGVPAGSPVEPAIGMSVRMYGRGIGYRVRGLFLDGKCVFYRTEAEDEARSKADMYGESARDWLERWDAGRGVWSIEMGGIGPGYEQAIQVTGAEVLRWLLEHNTDRGLKDFPAIEPEISGDLRERLAPIGLSGAQWGAACNIACVIYRNGPIRALELVDRDRHIQVSRTFPSLAGAPQ